ncbi:BON domain-containing protein [Sphaerospermopsis aphanizomenoides BCCUSP55]|uniref:BON domain-containing protein n=1 Tax=Sphaerospermopsis aphanizomenoides TaxID=459663 RepID=UPI00190485BE|nr:BON domain-containing protein [Sphaerospermopsis aphanizomenoides]MBK1990813.1 BON domain-containing protein [Sphaerospermopsis aphanizomenoides BCCUSP55]
MKNLITFVVSGILVAGVFGCQEAPKTSSQTPAKTPEATSIPAKPASQTTQVTEKTAQPVKSTTKTTIGTTKPTSDLKIEVSKKLKEGLPSSKLQVENKQGEIILKGDAVSEEEIKKAEALVKGVKGVKSVKVEAKVTPEKKQ